MVIELTVSKTDRGQRSEGQVTEVACLGGVLHSPSVCSSRIYHGDLLSTNESWYVLHAQVPTGQTINLTLINFARVGLPTDWTVPGGSVGPAAVRPKVCYQLADIRERTAVGGETVRTLTVCEGAERLSHVYTSMSNSVYVDVIVTKILNVHFLLHFEGKFTNALGFRPILFQ